MNNPESLAVDSTETPNLLAVLGAVVILLLIFARDAIEEWLNDLEQRHARAERLEAYRRRHAWKKSDIGNLLSLDVSASAKHRMERLLGTGRPVVRPHRPFVQEVEHTLTAVHTLIDPDSPAERRRKAFRQCPWWLHFVEALYRGEYALVKNRGIRNASAETEISVGKALGVSASTVHNICRRVRRERQRDPQLASDSSMTIAEYECWMKGEV
jgi:hypothetical protein